MTPIVVTGLARSGTTWVGRVLCCARRTYYAHEPLNPEHGIDRYSPGTVSGWYLHNASVSDLLDSMINDVLEGRFPRIGQLLCGDVRIGTLRTKGALIRDYGKTWITRLRRCRIVLKDPYALFLVPWLVSEKHCDVVVTIKHPAAYCSSLKRAGWRFNFREMWNQPGLLAELPATLADEVVRYSRQEGTSLTDGALLWKVGQAFVELRCRQFPGVKVVRHEDISTDPFGQFRYLYATLGLRWNRRVERYLTESTAGTNPVDGVEGNLFDLNRHSLALATAWKCRLSDREIELVHDLTKGVGQSYYPDSEW